MKRTYICIRDAIALICALLLIFAILAGNTSVVFCVEGDAIGQAGDAIVNAVSYGSYQVYLVMRAVVIPLCIVVLAWAGLLFLGGGNNGPVAAKKMFLACFAAVVFVTCAPMLGDALGSVFADFGNGDFSNYNPLT
ncbi:MAG TPA: hypothetical protein IAC31_02175 [Candidatus Faecousia intestinigallinarum]|nr:hypothetical protein [Candidatus Faecousia intestinigallinarum]